MLQEYGLSSEPGLIAHPGSPTVQVLALDDPFIPEDSAQPCPGAVPVRFFGTYEFAWIETLAGLAHFTEAFLDRCQKSKDQQFQVP